MLFDRVCGLAEKTAVPSLGYMKFVINKSNLFVITLDDIESVQNKCTDTEFRSNLESAPLIVPFDTCAVELQGRYYSFLLLINKLFKFDVRSNIKKEDSIEVTFIADEGSGLVTVQFTVSIQTILSDEISSFSNAYMEDAFYIYTNDMPDFKAVESTEFLDSSLSKMGQQGLGWFKMFLQLVNAQKSFILEEQPKNYERDAKKASAAGRLLRAHQRPQYTVLTPLAIRKKLCIDGGLVKSHKSPAPHERRRHKRRLRVESGYKEDRDIIIEATWVGPKEAVIGNKRYKVRLDV